MGKVIIFDPEPHGMPSRGRFGEVAALTRSTARRLDEYSGELLSLQAIQDYFQNLFTLEKDHLDEKKILAQIAEGKTDIAFPFASIADEFQLIDSATVSLIVPWDEFAQRIVDQMAWHPFPATLAKSLQPYVVQVYQYELLALESEGVVKTVGDFIKILTDSSFYDDNFGLKDAKEVKAPNAVLIL